MRRFNTVIAAAIFILTAAIAHADTFDNLTILQPVSQPITTGVNSFTWTFVLNQFHPGDPAALVFSFDIPPIAAAFQSVFALDGYETMVGKAFIDARLCGTGKCIGSASIILPRFYGTKSGTVQFSFGGKDSRVYQFQLMEPVPERLSILVLPSLSVESSFLWPSLPSESVGALLRLGHGKVSIQAIQNE